MSTEQKPEKETTMDIAIPAQNMSLEMADRISQFQLAQRKAKALMATDLLPKAHQGKIGNIIIICEIAQRMNMHELMVAQNLNVIHGKPGWSSAFLMAMLRASKLFRSLNFEFKELGEIQIKIGDKMVPLKNRECKLVAVDQFGQTIEGPPVSIEMAVKEGWYGREGSKWPTLTDLMLRYRSTAFFVRTCAPEVVLGLSDQTELEDTTIDLSPSEDRRPKLRNATPEPTQEEPQS